MELVMMGALCVLMGRVAGMDEGRPWLWTALTALLCGASLMIDLPLTRVLIVGVVVFAAMTTVNMIKK